MRVPQIGTSLVVLLLATSDVARSPLDRCDEGAETRLEVKPGLERQLAIAEASLRQSVETSTGVMQELGRVTGRSDALDAYRAAREEFRRFREMNFSWCRIPAESDTRAGDIELDCLVRMTQARVAEVRQVALSQTQPGDAKFNP